MEKSKLRYLLAASASLGALASPAAVPDPVITPAALLPRADYRTLGWYSDVTTDGQTIYAPWEYDIEATTYSSSGQFFRRCPVTTSCIMYTGCSNGFLMGPSTSSYCGAGGASGSVFCSNHILLPTLGATSSALSWFWCDEAPLTGITFFAREPAQPTQVSSSESTAAPVSSDATTTTSDTSRSTTATASTSSQSSTGTSEPSSEDSKTNVGAIAGGVVGGVAVLGAIGVALFFILTRRKRKNANAQPPTGYQPPPGPGPMSPHPPSGFPQGPNTEYSSAYQANEAKPQGIQELGGYYPQPYPQGPYDPHMSQHYPGSPPPMQQSPQAHYAAPQLLPQELPATQK